jgi:hypothetical protein
LLSLAVWGGHAHALGLGAITLQSGLGRPLQAKIPVYGMVADDAGAVCLKARVLALDGSLLSRPVAELAGSGAGTTVSMRTVESINEPAVNVSVEIGCASAVRREYQLLLDPSPALLPMASPTRADGPEGAERSGRKAASLARVTAAPGSAVIKANAPVRARHRPPAPAQPRQAAATRSVLTLTGNAEIEQVGTRLALRSATVLSEPRVQTDPARLAALRADQASVAALLRGEDPAAAAQAQLRDAQDKLQALQQSAAGAARRHAQEKAALAAAQEDMVPGKLAALLGALLLACIAVIGWLLWRRAGDRHRQEQAFFAMAPVHDAPVAESLQPPHAKHATQRDTVTPVLAPLPEQGLEAEPVDFTMPADDLAPLPAPAVSPWSDDWRTQAVTPAVSSPPAESLDMRASWLSLDNHAGHEKGQAPRAAPLLPAVAAAADYAQAHAAEVAGMLLAAESWMAEHNPLRAAEVLRPYLDRDDMQSPAPGLYLLSLYRTMDDKGQIATLLAQMEQDFPAEAAAWRSPGQWRRSMADFPAVHAAVDSLSDSDRLPPYLNSLLLAPEPFDFSTYRDIVHAIGLAREMETENDAQSMSLDFQ